MKYISLLTKIHDQSGKELTGGDLYSLIEENFSHPKALQIRKLLLERKIIKFVGFDKKDTCNFRFYNPTYITQLKLA